MDTDKPAVDCVDYKDLDGQIESLMKCSPLPETEVKALCDKAREILQVKCCSASPPRQNAAPAIECGLWFECCQNQPLTI